MTARGNRTALLWGGSVLYPRCWLPHWDVRRGCGRLKWTAQGVERDWDSSVVAEKGRLMWLFQVLLKLPCREIREEKNPSYEKFVDNISKAAEITTPLVPLYINSWNENTYRWPYLYCDRNKWQPWTTKFSPPSFPNSFKSRLFELVDADIMLACSCCCSCCYCCCQACVCLQIR